MRQHSASSHRGVGSRECTSVNHVHMEDMPPPRAGALGYLNAITVNEM